MDKLYNKPTSGGWLVKLFSLPEKNLYWMKNGISQLEKGKIDGYNLINE
jgi:hypothetical protein